LPSFNFSERATAAYTFTEALTLAPLEAAAPWASATPPAHTLVTFTTSGQSAPWTSSDPDATLLSFAEEQGLEPAFSCRAGVCGTCACRVIEGEVTYISEPSAPVARGSALICIAKPKGANLSLEL
jgi:ferredoxin